MISENSANEQQAALAFSRQAVHFDELYAANAIIKYKRERVRAHVQEYLPGRASILELNAGTGEDAIWFAQQGHSVHATDISTGMLTKLNQKISAAGLNKMVTSELCSFTSLEKLDYKGPFDSIFSNFAGLNCTGELDKVLSSFSPLLKPGGLVTLVVLPKFCLWESLLVFRGKFKTASRRFFAKNGRKAHVESEHFKCWYYNPSYIRKCLRSEFEVLKIEGLCTFVPPSYIEHFAEKHPVLYRRLQKIEGTLKAKWPWRCIGDYYIISLRKH